MLLVHTDIAPRPAFPTHAAISLMALGLLTLTAVVVVILVIVVIRRWKR
jgi:hypothetical protein